MQKMFLQSIPGSAAKQKATLLLSRLLNLLTMEDEVEPILPKKRATFDKYWGLIWILRPIIAVQQLSLVIANGSGAVMHSDSVLVAIQFYFLQPPLK